MIAYRIPVSLLDRSYDIEIAPNLLTLATTAERIAGLAGKSRCCLVTHPLLKPLYADPLISALEGLGVAPTVVVLPAGEHGKTLRAVSKLYDAFLEAKLDRKSLVIAVGGGVLGDVVGFASASYLRGVRFLQVPTTLLAQVDASVGGKTGVDLPQGKNLVGAFHQPCGVLIDTNTLRTLPARELRSGLAEVIKYGVIYDAGFFKRTRDLLPLLLKRDESALAEVIARSCEIKAEVVAQDETEQGLRAILNFGHTLGHALEAVTRYRTYKHGEAIAIGMVAESRIAERLGMISAETTEALREALSAARLPVAFPQDIDVEAILESAQRDKKSVGGRIGFVLPTRMGEVVARNDISAESVREALRAC